MQKIPDKSIDMILCDLPYGTTACKWDTIIPFEPLWEQYKRIIKENGAIVLTASQPFTTALISSNKDMFRYIWYWRKEKGTGFANSGKMPLKIFEDCIVFYKSMPRYTPPKELLDKPYKRKITDNTKSDSSCLASRQYINTIREYTHKTPINEICVSRESQAKESYHPTQKPVALFEYLIKTYTNEGDLVLDNCAGSGTTGVACKNLNRNFILIEKEQEYIDIINKRLN